MTNAPDATTAAAAAPYATAGVTFLAETPADGKLWYVPQAAGSTQTEEWPGTYARVPIAIHDARPLIPTLSLDAQGFTLVETASAVSDWQSDEEVAGTYYEEVKATLLKHIPGAVRVEVFDHTRRSDSREVQVGRTMRQPADKVHGDYTDASGPRRLATALPEVAAETKGRWLIVNLWRSTAGTIERAPLTLCDQRTVRPEEQVRMERRAPGRLGEVFVATHAEAQRWYAFPRMTGSEAVLFKTFDSDEAEGRTRWCLHTAFADPNSPPDAPPRESIEVRAFVFFKEE